MRKRAIGLILLQGVSMAEEVGQKAAEAGMSLPSLVLRTILGLGFVLLLIYGMVFILRRAGWGAQQNGDDVIKLISARYLAPRRAIALLYIGKRILVVALDGGAIRKIAEITDPEEIDGILSKVAGSKPFSQLLGRFTR